MATVDPARYAPAIAQLLSAPRLNPLDAGRPEEAVRAQLEALADDRLLLPLHVRQRDQYDACRAGLFLHFNFHDDSHRISQELHTPTGSYWHAILHRREPDPANAAYWFRRVGEHPIFETLAREAQALGLRLTSGRWDPFAFIDLCEQHRGTGTGQELLLRQVQQREWELLFDWCYHQAVDSI